jgi:hypothetical protein
MATILAKTGVTLLFGIDAGITALTGYIANDADWDNASKTADAMDSQGSTVAVAFYDQMIDVKVNALLISGTTLPLPGTTVTLTTGSLPGALAYAVMKSSGKEKANGFTFATIDLRRWVDNSIG